MPGSNVIHFGSTRMRVIGSGELKQTFYSLDPSISQDLADITMSAVNNKEPARIANFVSQRSKLKIQVTAIDEWFKINTLIIFVRPIYTMFPE